ncbi:MULTISPECIES: hypothetical protein [Acinetobacter]|uniref:hypothetical protein n=1 Tax=Acinetobacter TaxID=469 RepID=UPI0002CDFDA6|nr:MULTISPECIES: hypothetical protein [Acinetobacter]ENU59075.1 hypothetical protein F981_03384 [Acinetobacter guillouiae CIP 63.46]KAB0625817.1 hypothetical protein F7P82_16050 [Acinetobacter guillouiae]
MLANKFFKLILVSVLFLFAITTTGIYTWAPVIAKNLDHHHELSISVETEDSSQWSLVHHDEVLNTADQDKKNHNWTSYDEPAFHHSVKPIQADDHFSIDPVFFLSFALPLILLFLGLFERPIRSFKLRKRIPFLCNTYAFTKTLIVLRD